MSTTSGSWFRRGLACSCLVDNVRFVQEGCLLRIFIGEADHRDGAPAYKAIVEAAHAQGLAGATVFRGIEGFGAGSLIHRSSGFRLSHDLPIVIEIVDTQDAIDQALPTLESLVGDGMMTVERAEIVLDRKARDPAEPVIADRLRLLEVQVGAASSDDEAHDQIQASIRATSEYGASQSQLERATGLSGYEIRRILDEAARPTR